MKEWTMLHFFLCSLTSFHSAQGTEALQEYLKLHPNMTTTTLVPHMNIRMAQSLPKTYHPTLENIKSMLSTWHTWNLISIKPHLRKRPSTCSIERLRIKSVAPDARIIMLLCDPVERAWKIGTLLNDWTVIWGLHWAGYGNVETDGCDCGYM